jgi:hypothetical protein
MYGEYQQDVPNTCTFLIKQFDKPKTSIEYEEVNFYNFFSQVPKRSKFEQVSFELHNDIKNESMNFIVSYLRRVCPIFNQEQAMGFEENGMNFDNANSSYGLHTTTSNTNIIQSIKIFDIFNGNRTMDVYTFNNNDNINKVLLLLSSSAIPGIFPPIEYNGYLYADGGTVSNELLQVEHGGYLNITYITPYEGFKYDSSPITSLKDMLIRTFEVATGNFNNPLATMNQNCAKPIGEINKYFVDAKFLSGYSSMNFDYGTELIEIGYKYASKKTFKIC